MKICPTCSETKPRSDFAPNRSRTDGLQAQCRPCYAAYQREYYRKRTATDDEYRQQRLRRSRNERQKRENRQKLWTYLASHPCVDCGERDPVVLEFDHADGTHKAFAVGDGIFRRPWQEVSRELLKCDVRCANCHRRRTAEQRGFYTYLDDGT